MTGGHRLRLAPPAGPIAPGHLGGFGSIRWLTPLVTPTVDFYVVDEEIVSEMALLVYNATGVRVAIVDMRSSEGARILHKGATTFHVDLHSVHFVEGEYDLGLYYRSLRSSGDYYNLGRIVIAPRMNAREVLPFAPQHRGLVELAHAVAVSSSPILD